MKKSINNKKDIYFPRDCEYCKNHKFHNISHKGIANSTCLKNGMYLAQHPYPMNDNEKLAWMQCPTRYRKSIFKYMSKYASNIFIELSAFKLKLSFNYTLFRIKQIDKKIAKYEAELEEIKNG